MFLRFFSMMSMIRIIFLLSFIFPLAACATKQVELDTLAHERLLEKDMEALGLAISEKPPISEGKVSEEKLADTEMHLSLNDAVERGLLYNFDARLAAFDYLAQQDQITLAQLGSLPSITAKARRVGRSNQGASSSKSAIDGDISLEPSFSTQPHRNLLELEAKWNLTEATIAYIDARTQSNRQNILRTRYEKVRNGIARDVYSAYWKALAYQQNRDDVRTLLGDLEMQIENLRKAKDQKLISSGEFTQRQSALLNAKTDINAQYRQLKLASSELKSLLSLPVDAKIVLSYPSVAIAEKYQGVIKADISQLEMDALRSSPELREEILLRNTIANTRRKEILKALPGAEFLYALNRDTNEFLLEHDWANYSVSLTQKLTELITLPLRLETIANDSERSRLKRLNLSFAIISQIHIAHQQLLFAHQSLESASSKARLSSRQQNYTQALLDTGIGSGENHLKARLEKQITRLREVSAHSDVQNAYANLAYSLGQSVTSFQQTTSLNAGGGS